MENQTNKQILADKKTSKAIIAIFIIVLIEIIGFIFSWFSFDTYTYLVINLVFSSAFVYLIYYTKKRAIKKGLGGLKLATFSLYAFSAITIFGLIGSIALISYSKKLDEFATNTTSAFFDNDFAVLKENSTENLKRIISYDKEMADLKKELIDVGKVNECVKEKGDYIVIAFGPKSNVFDKTEEFSIGLTGKYSRRCYGENKSFDIKTEVEYKDGKWLVDSYNIKSDIGKEIFEKEDTDKNNEIEN